MRSFMNMTWQDLSNAIIQNAHFQFFFQIKNFITHFYTLFLFYIKFFFYNVKCKLD